MPIMTQATEASIATKVTMAQVNADAQLSGTDQVTGLDAALTSKADADGTNATGTWNINIDGNAATASQAAVANAYSGTVNISQVVGLQDDLNSKLNALEAFTVVPSPRNINFALDLNNVLYCNNAGPINLDVVDPNDESVPIGWKCMVLVTNAKVNIIGGTNTNIETSATQTANLSQYDFVLLEKIFEIAGVSTYIVKGADHPSGSNPQIVTVTDATYAVPESLNGGLIRVASTPDCTLTFSPTLSQNFRVKVLKAGNNGNVIFSVPGGILDGNITQLTQSLAAVDVFKVAEFQFEIVMSQLKAGENITIGNDASINATGDVNPTPGTLVERGEFGEINGVNINATGTGTLSAQSFTAGTVPVINEDKALISSIVAAEDLLLLASANDGTDPDTLVLRNSNSTFANSGYNPVTDVAGDTYQLSVANINGRLNFSSTNNVTVTLPLFAASPIPAGSMFLLNYVAGGTSVLSVSAPVGVTLVGGAASVGSGGTIWLQKRANDIWQVLYIREDVSATVTTSGAITGSLNISFRRINKTIDFAIENFSGTATATSLITATIAQNRFFPPVTWRGFLVGLVNGENQQIYTSISTAGVITFGAGVENTNFVSGQSFTLYASNMTYRIAIG